MNMFRSDWLINLDLTRFSVWGFVSNFDSFDFWLFFWLLNGNYWWPFHGKFQFDDPFGSSTNFNFRSFSWTLINLGWLTRIFIRSWVSWWSKIDPFSNKMNISKARKKLKMMITFNRKKNSFAYWIIIIII